MKKKVLQEEWKPLYDYEGYEVSNFGNIRSLDRIIICADGPRRVRGKLLKRRNNGIEPHLFVGVNDDKRNRKCVSVYCAKAMMDHFSPRPTKHHKYVTPLDGDHTNIHPYNYKWLTAKELISNQPNRLKDPTKAWRTRKNKYGKRGTNVPVKEITQKRVSAMPSFFVKVKTEEVIGIKVKVENEGLNVNIKGKYSIVKGTKKNIYYNFLRKFNIEGYSSKIQKEI
jgi:hypothetical protein